MFSILPLTLKTDMIVKYNLGFMCLDSYIDYACFIDIFTHIFI